jgi:hypothetical protein
MGVTEHEFGLEVVALVGVLRYGEHRRSVPEIHAQLQQRNICISQRSVSHLIEGYEELLALPFKQQATITGDYP